MRTNISPTRDILMASKSHEGASELVLIIKVQETIIAMIL